MIKVKTDVVMYSPDPHETANKLAVCIDVASQQGWTLKSVITQKVTTQRFVEASILIYTKERDPYRAPPPPIQRTMGGDG